MDPFLVAVAGIVVGLGKLVGWWLGARARQRAVWLSVLDGDRRTAANGEPNIVGNGHGVDGHSQLVLNAIHLPVENEGRLIIDEWDRRLVGQMLVGSWESGRGGEPRCRYRPCRIAGAGAG